VEQDRLLVQRLPVTIAAYLLMVGCAIAAEWVLHAERRFAATVIWAAHVGASSLGLVLLAFRPRRLPIRWLAVGLACLWSLILGTYTVFVDGNPERVASAQISLLYGLFFMLPWGWRQQFAVSVAALAGLAASALAGAPTEPFVYAVIFIATGMLTSVGGVFYLDRYRLAGFVRHAQLVQASREKEEEAEIAAALLHVSESLSQHVNEPDLLAHLTRVAVETVGCDWGSTFAGRAAGSYGLAGLGPAGVRQEIGWRSSRPITAPRARAVAGALIRWRTSRPGVVPPALLLRWGVSSQLVAPITLGGRVVGGLCLAHGVRRGPFSERERRLARGIVHATALALANSSLIASLRAADKLRSEFVSTMSHELRTPLNVILGFAEMARDASLQERDRSVPWNGSGAAATRCA
jgi:signal transduction histidine kinase